MSKTSKSPRKVALVALRIGEKSLPRYAHRFAPKTFTQPQLFSCLVLKAFFKADYRSIVAYLRDMPTLRADLGLQRVPHYTTLQKAARRMLRCTRIRRLLQATVQCASTRRRQVDRAAIDSTGFESSRISPYFVRRRASKNACFQGMKYKRYPKLHIVVDCRNHLVLATYTCRGPTPDVHQLRQTIHRLPENPRVDQLLADAGYDSEMNHQWLREELGIRSLIPAKVGRVSPRPPRGKYRRLMRTLLETNRRTCFGQRWQVETVMSMIKGNLGHTIEAKSHWARCRQMNLKAITHNIMILLHQTRPFLQGRSDPVLLPWLKHQALGLYSR